MAKKEENIVYIECPRCMGAGQSQAWRPDFGICYRCRGRKAVRINIKSHRGALWHLRQKWLRVAKQLAKEKDPSEREFLEQHLAYIEQDGNRVRWELEYAESLLDK